jgi:hypothetical protein
MRNRHADLLEGALDPHLLLDLALQLVLFSSTFVERVPRIVDVEPIVVLTRRKLYKQKTRQFFWGLHVHLLISNTDPDSDLSRELKLNFEK